MEHPAAKVIRRAQVSIKGTSDGLVIQLGAGDWNALLLALAEKLNRTPSFFRGGRVALNVGPRVLTPSQLETLGGLLNKFQISLWAVLSDSVETQRVAAEMGLETSLALSRMEHLLGEKPNGQERMVVDGQSAILVRRIVRCGQSVCHAGHVIVIGDVNPGAEIIAGGDVVVWGRLRGNVHAGSNGNERAIVCALVLAPTLLRIAGYVACSLEHEDKGAYEPLFVPGVAFVRHGQIVAEPWRATDGPYGDWRADLLRRAANTLSTWF